MIHSFSQRSFAHKNEHSLKKSYFSYVFDSFSPLQPFFRAHCSRRSLFKEWTWANRSLQNIDCEQLAQVAHDKRATWAIFSFSQANRSFAHKKMSDLLETDEWIPNPAKYSQKTGRWLWIWNWTARELERDIQINSERSPEGNSRDMQISDEALGKDADYCHGTEVK